MQDLTDNDEVYDFMPGEVQSEHTTSRLRPSPRRLKKTTSLPVGGLVHDFDQTMVQVLDSDTEKVQRSPRYATDDMTANLSITSKQEIRNLPYVPQHIRIAVSITSARSTNPVFHKDEGARFTGLSDQVHSTIKLVNNKMYVLSLTIVPPVKLSNDLISVKAPPALSRAVIQQEYVQLSLTSVTEDSSTFKGFWTCRTIRNKDKQRNIITLQMKVADFGTVTMPIMAKTYEKMEFGIKQGRPLKYVVYDFQKDRYDPEPELKSIEHYSNTAANKDDDILTNDAMQKAIRFNNADDE